METHQRPKRQTKKISRSDDFLDNYDAELEAIESLPSTSVKPLLAPLESGPRKRGRSGKHQKAAAAAAAAAVMFAAASGAATESAVTSCAVSAAPSVNVIAAPMGSRDLLPPAATPYIAEALVEPKENGSLTPHYPPRDNASPATESEEGSPCRLPPPPLPQPVKAGGLEPKNEPSDDFYFPAASSKLAPADTPTPKPRNRRKGGAPTKTE